MFATHTTGNLWFALPRITPPPGGVKRLAFLMMGHRGLIELLSGDDSPLLSGDIVSEGVSLLAGGDASLDADWIPRYTAATPGHEASLTWLTPHDVRGLIARLSLHNRGAAPLEAELSFRLRWGRTLVTTYDAEPLEGRLALDPNGWGDGVSLAWCTARTEFAVGVGKPAAGAWDVHFEDADGKSVWHGDPTTGQRDRFAPGVRATLQTRRRVRLAPGESAHFDLYLSIALDTKACCFDTRTMREQTYERLYDRTRAHLLELNRRVPAALAIDDALGPLVRRNRLFCYFYSLGRTLDTEEIAPVTSRSSDYYVSAAYWDRDSLLWSFPTILDMDHAMAGRVIEVAFGRQGANIGTHSRFITGAMYEPGFELDELVAPLIALDRYLHATGNWRILDRIPIVARIEQIEHELAARRHATLPFVSTEYLPTDDLDPYPYCIYDNVLLWHACGILARLLERLGQPDRAAAYGRTRDALHAAICEHGTMTLDGQRLFAWSTDLSGHYRAYDEPPGSLLLLPYYGFCSSDDPTWRATLAWVYSTRNPHYFAEWDEIGCHHAPHPWILAVANSLLVPERRASALTLLRKARMDDGFACESIDERTGEVKTGGHFATCAGFLCHALCTAFREHG